MDAFECTLCQYKKHRVNLQKLCWLNRGSFVNPMVQKHWFVESVSVRAEHVMRQVGPMDLSRFGKDRLLLARNGWLNCRTS